MPLALGTRLGPYEITGPLGKGGMGEVYRAKDTKLDREVAIKVLPSSLARDPERLVRFEREAKLLASLNHANIATVYSLEESPEGKAIAMELVDGTTLKTPVPLDTALHYARQIAEALEAAHERGITHRDLKPANIMVTPAGLIKILDFGLAAVTRPPAETGEDSPTLTIGMTEAGMIMGTAGYMAPEQAVGQTVDKRADIWAFGVVLWQMLVGKQLFSGETTAHILANVINANIDFGLLPPTTPAQIRDLIQRCLDRDVKTRLQVISEARIAIQRYQANPQPAVVAAAPVAQKPASRVWMIAASVLGIAAIGLAAIHFREVPEQQPVLTATLLPPEGGSFDFTTYAIPAISPDGSRIVFGAKGADGKVMLYVRRLDSPTAQALPGTQDAVSPFWSPDSRFVAFGQGNSLKKIDIQGGPSVTITAASNVRGGTWNQDGVIVYGVNNGLALSRVAASGGTSTPASTLRQSDTSGHRYPVFLPDQKHFLYTSPLPQPPFPLCAGVLDDAAQPCKVVAQVSSNALYAAGHLFYLRENTLVAQPFDAAKLETTGEPVPVAEHVPTFGYPSLMAGFAVSSTGLLVYQQGGLDGQSQMRWMDREGKVLKNIVGPMDRIAGLELSPDEKTLAATILAQGNFDLWMIDLSRELKSRFTFDPATDREAVWTPDGATIVWRSNRKGAEDLFRKAANGVGTEEELYASKDPKRPASISPDGDVLLYEAPGPSKLTAIWEMKLNTPQGEKPQPRVFIEAPGGVSLPRFSPDGKWVVYTSVETGTREVYVVPYPGPGGKRQISSGGGDFPRWRKDGKELFYVAGNNLMSAEILTQNGTLDVGAVHQLPIQVIGTLGYLYAPAANGQKFIVAQIHGAQTAEIPLTLIQNWPALLSKK